MTGLNEYGLMAVAGTVKEVKDNVVTLTVTENMKQADGKWADVQRTIECDVTKAGGADGVEKGMDFCALGHGIPTEGGNMEMTAKAFGIAIINRHCNPAFEPPSPRPPPGPRRWAGLFRLFTIPGCFFIK